MDIQENWEKALRQTEIIRHRIQGLATFTVTNLPYVLLSESVVNMGDTVVRRGTVMVEKPALILPANLPQFEGFDFNREVWSYLTNFFLVRGVTLPSLKYNNQLYSVDVYEGKLTQAIEHYDDNFKRTENVQAGLVVGPTDVWQFSLLIFVAAQVERSANNDIRRILEEFKKREQE
ncbi:MAG: hypothetical protein V1653_03210 [bacterium]